MAVEGRANPARSAVAVDVSSTDQALSPECRALYVGGAGDVEVNMADTGSAIVFTCVAGQILPINAVKVLNANTTATAIVALY